MRDASLDLLVDLARPTSHDTVLDYATGAGMAGFTVAPDVATVEAADELPDMLEEGKRLAAELGLVNVAFTLVDLYALPYKDGAFSLIVCRNAFHLLPDPATALAELQRVLSAGGRVVILDAVVDDDDRQGVQRDRPAARAGAPAALPPGRARRASSSAPASPCASRGSVRSTIDLDYWLQAAAVPPPKADLIRGRFKVLPVEVQARLDVAFSDRLVSFSYDVAGLRLERA